MLTRDLLRFKVDGGRIIPRLLKPTPGNVDLAERLVAFWRAGLGARRGELEEQLTPLLHQSRALLVARGLSRLVEDECAFTAPASCAEARTQALVASARLLRAPAATAEEHRAACAQALALAPDALAAGLYADLPDSEVLESAPEIAPRALIERYNLALCQGLLLGARSLSVEVDDADTGLRRRLLKALRFRRLLAEVAQRGATLRLEVSGPASVLDQSTRYGLQLALFLPALACARSWRAQAEIAATSRAGGKQRGMLELSQELGLVGDSAFLGHVPEELTGLDAALRERFPAWRIDEPQLLPLPTGELVVPDLQVVVDGRTIAIELFHRWHATALARRLEQIQRGLLPRFIVGVDRALAKTTACAPLVAGEAFAKHGFLFTEIPTPRAIGEAVERTIEPRG
jgi:predicted nuclease of restriction endonuclease-like RecB superfamily